MKVVLSAGILSIVITFLMFQVNVGQCKTLEKDVTLVREGRRIENFSEFSGEGDQLAVETIENEETGGGSGTGGKREILGKKKSSSSGQLDSKGRQCPNVHKVALPVIPVIIASLIGLIGAIIISAIVRGISGMMHGSHDDMGGYATPGYERRRSYPSMLSNFFGFNFDTSKIDFIGLTKKVLQAVEKIY